MHFPILIYHDIIRNNQVNNETHAIPVDEFRRQMEYLVDNGFKSLSLSEILRTDINSNETNQKIVAISFDDGHYSDFSLTFPLLTELKFVGNFFITVDWIGKAGYVTWDNLTEMQSEGMEIQSHTMTHRFLSSLNKSDMHKELRESKDKLEQRLNSRVDFVSLPGGFGSNMVSRIADQENYKGLCTSMPGWNEIISQSFFVLNRLNITRNTSFNTFKKIVDYNSKLIGSLRATYRIKSLIRKVIGNRLYYRLWSRFRKEI